MQKLLTGFCGLVALGALVTTQVAICRHPVLKRRAQPVKYR